MIYHWLIHTYIWSEHIRDGWERGPRIRFICYVTRQLLLFVRLLRWILSLKHVASSDLGCTLAISSDLLSFSLTADENNYANLHSDLSLGLFHPRNNVKLKQSKQQKWRRWHQKIDCHQREAFNVNFEWCHYHHSKPQHLFFQTKGQSDFNLQAGKHILMPSVNITGPKQSRLRM